MSYTKKTIIGMLAILAVCVMMIGLNTEQSFAATTTYESEPNDEMYQADVFPFGDGNVFQGNVKDDHFHDTDWVKFTIPESGFVTMTFTASGIIGPGINNTGAQIPFYDESEEDIAWLYAEYKSSLGYVYGERHFYLSKGTYYFSVHGADDDDTYSMKMNFKPVKDDLAELNNTLGNATTILTNKLYYGIISEGSSFYGDTDFVKVEIPSSGTYYFNLKYKNYNEPSFYVEEYKTNGDWKQDIISVSSNSMAENTRAVTTAYLTKGTHYFRFRTYDGHDTEYSFDISKKLTKVTGLKASKVGKGKVKLSWNAKAGATGYRIYRKSPATGKYVYIGKTTEMTYTDKKARAGKANYYKVKAYRKINGYSEQGFLSTAVSREG